MSKGLRWISVLSILALAAGWAHAADPAGQQDWVGETLSKCCGGGDIRIRQVYLDEIPIIADPPGITRGGDNHFFRFRTRLWGQYDPMDNVTVKARVVNEFRHYDQPDNETMDPLDEIVVDQLYLEIRNLLDEKIDIKIGRQDMIYGTGKVILEGTPKDGSRTIYMDAAKLTFKGVENTTIDIFGIYNEPENDLVLNSQDRDIVGLAPGYNDMTESGGGLYLKNKGLEALPCELYYIYKEESDWTQPARLDPVSGAFVPPSRPGQTLDEVAGLYENPTLELHTLGARIMPKWSDIFDGSVEVAIQDGDRGEVDAEGMMVDGVLNCNLPVLPDMKPKLSAGVYYLSGDDPATADDEEWNPLWARWPQYSELYIYAFDADGAGRWSNVMMPHVDLSLVITEKIKAKAMIALLEAPEENGPGGGDERGVLGSIRTDFTLAENLLLSKDKLFGHLLLEVLDPGDYYNVDDTAYFARWELSYAF